MSLSGEPEASSVSNRVQVKRAGSPVSSCLSMKSDRSMDPPENFRGDSPADPRVQVQRAGSPVSSCLSMKSDRSMDPPENFRGESITDPRVQVKRAGSLVSSCLSMKSDRSMDPPENFRGDSPADPRVQVQRAGSPVSSCLSMKSDRSMDPPENFRGESPADPRVQVQRAGSPVSSCLSMKSDRSMDPPENFRGDSPADPRVQVKRAGSPVSSCLSMKSDRSMDPPENFRGDSPADPRVQVKRASSVRSYRSMDPPENLRGESPANRRVKRAGSPIPSYRPVKSYRPVDLPLPFREESRADPMVQVFCELEDKSPSQLEFKKQSLQRTLMKLEKEDLKQFHSRLSQYYPECTESLLDDLEALHMVEKMLETCGSERSEEITVHILRNMKQKDPTNSLERDKQHNEHVVRAQETLKADLKKKFECICEGLALQGHPTLLNEIYTELYITEGGHGEVNNEHEIRQIETASRRQTTQETAILCNDIFKPLPGQEKRIRTVLTKGIAGIGKTVSVQKFILDWAEGKANQDIHFIFSLHFRDLNFKKEKEFSLMQLLQLYFPQLKEIKSVEHEAKIVFIFDGLDECRLPLDFQNNEICCDVTESASVDVLLTNLIKGNLLPSALLWITSRPAAANQITPECVHRVTEIRGFNDPQKEEYFKKRIRDENLASRIISHIKSSRSLYIMCHIPVFCWISAKVLETLLDTTDSGKLPRTLTEMYTHFLFIQTNVKNHKYGLSNETNTKKISTSDTDFILKLGKLAFQQLEKGNLIFYEENLRESGIDVSEASVYSGVCTEIFKEESGLHQEKVYCFVHLSIQEYLAALFVFHSCVNENRNVLTPVEEDDDDEDDDDEINGERTQLSELQRCAVNQALHSKNGHLDLFLRFLLGLSLDSTQTLFGELLPRSGSRSESIRETIWYIKQKIRKMSSAERTINLFHCLNELDDTSLVEEIQTALRSGRLSDKELEPHQCSALAFVLLMSEEVLDEFESKTYNTSAAGHQRLVPVVRNCRKAILNSCDLSKQSCEIVASALQSSNSPLRELDLSFSNMGDSGVKLLCAGLKSPNCKLQKLGLGWCNLTEGCCDDLASVLRSPLSELRDLELRDNELQDAGVRALSAGLEDPHCKLERLGLSGCRVTESGCDSLASALRSNPSHLRELDLSYNHPGDSGVRTLSAAKLDTLTLLVDHGGESRNKPGPRKYGCQLSLDLNTTSWKLSLSEGDRMVTYTRGTKEPPYPDHPDRFDFMPQVLCGESLTGRCYWEAEWSEPEVAGVSVTVTHKGIGRKGKGDDCMFGLNKNSWSLYCSKHRYTLWHSKKKAHVPTPPSPYRRVGGSLFRAGERVYRVGVYVDYQAGTLSFYSVSDSDTLTLLYRDHTNFTEPCHTPLCAGFGAYRSNNSVSLCQM